MNTSEFLKLNGGDFIKGLVVAILSAVLTTVLDLINSGADFSNINWKLIATASITAGLAYLLKNLSQNSNGNFGKEAAKN
jgi:uncharacterized membrane protein YjjP (DUF1212 family)